MRLGSASTWGKAMNPFRVKGGSCYVDTQPINDDMGTHGIEGCTAPSFQAFLNIGSCKVQTALRSSIKIFAWTWR